MQRCHEVSLEDSGFVVLPKLISAEKRERLSLAYDAAMSTGSAPDLRVSRDGSNIRLNHLIDYGTEFDDLLVLGSIMDLCEHVIGRRFKLSGLLARTVLPGATEQSLHVDVAVNSADWPLVGFIVMVDDFRDDNGATRFVPGSHKWAQAWKDATTKDRPVHDQCIAACGLAGSVIVFNGSTWHAQGANVSNAPRRSIQGAYIPLAGTCATDWRSLQSQILARLPSGTKQILGAE
jgi:hypothetical protein